MTFEQFPFPCRTRFFRLVASTSLDLKIGELVILKNVNQTSFFMQVALKTSLEAA